MKYTFLILVSTILTYSFSFSQQFDFGVGIDFSQYPYSETRKQKEEKKLPPDPIIEQISKKFEQDPEKINNLFKRGYGYVELIKILLIARQSGKDIDEIIKLREKNQKFSEVTKKFNLDYEKIHNDAYKIKSEVEENETSVNPSQSEIEKQNPNQNSQEEK